MALEQFKTQVLLLHSEQVTLDILSSGFGDKYAVHCATSGVEALNTLGETPIHVIVSAQDLPGMSGLEALREAKKRSPDTIGILLASGNKNDGLEALVGDQEVFQIVRGSVTPDSLLELIESATKRVRLATLSESANDQAANVDEPSSEHIVMETSENGSTIISDGTGTMPALGATSGGISTHPGSRNVDVLVVTQDEEFLATIKESTRGLHKVHYSATPAQAEEIVQNNKVGVLVTDAAMVGSNVEDLTQHLRSKAPRLIAIVAGRRDDGELLMDLINRGQVYRFLLKPVSPGRARLAIEASTKYHLDAPDSAFKGKKGAAKPLPKPKSAAKPKSVAAPTPIKTPQREAKVAAKQTPVKQPTEATPDKISAVEATGASRITPTIATPTTRADLDDAFSEEGSFAETMTGIAATVGKSLSGSRPSTPKIATASGGTSGALRNPKILGIGAASIAVIGVLGWLISNWQSTPSEPVPEESSGVPTIAESDIPITPAEDAVETVSRPAYLDLLDEARSARDTGDLIFPVGSNAVELYLTAMAAAPDDASIAAELDDVVVQVIGIAEGALLDEATDEAAAALNMVRLADVDNPRLSFLEAQLAQIQMRATTNDARLAIREGRFEDASTLIATALELNGGESAEINLLADELAEARGRQEVGDVIVLANERLDSGNLISPSNDNARYYYELALSSDPENQAAQQGLTIVASKLVLQARDAMDQGLLDDAQALLTDAQELDPSSNEVTASATALENALSEQAENERRAEIERQAAAAGQAEFDQLATNEESIPAAATGNDEEAVSTANENTDSESTPIAADSATTFALAGDGDGAANIEPESATSSDIDDDGDTTGTTPFVAQPASSEAALVAISELTRTNYVAPTYPRVAQRRDVSGSVDVSFTVGTDGSVSNVAVIRSQPDDVFDDAAVDAVAQWRFEPTVENGVAVEKRTAVRMAFNLN